MAVDGWYVVKFIDENTIEPIPNSWMINFNVCLWPNISTKKITWAIKNSIKPPKKNTWTNCKIKVLCKKLITNFSEASKMANNFLTQSSTETEVCTPKIITKKRKKRSVKQKMIKESENDSSSTNDSNSSDSDSDLPKFPKFSSKLTI